MLLSFLRDDLAEEVLGDLQEKFDSTVAKASPLKAKLNYWYQVFHYVRPFALRKARLSFNHYAMFENHYKIAWRNLFRQKMYSAVKIGGFAIGIAACLLIALFIRQELSYDRHYTKADRMYRVIRESTINGERSKGLYFPAPFVKVLEDDYPEIEKAGHYIGNVNFGGGSNEIRRVDEIESTHEEGFLFMDQHLFEILELPLIYGSPKNALTEPKTMLITRRKADKYFPGEDPVGKLFILNNDVNRQFKVSGVVENFPVTSHLQCDFIMTMADQEFFSGEQTNWGASNYIDYVVVRPGTDVDALEQKLSSIVRNHYLPAEMQNGRDAGAVAWVKSLQFRLQPVRDIYLNKEGIGDDLDHGDVRYIWLFGSIAAFILLIACINFINLSTARSANRAKEVGLRKVVGSHRGSLISQFLTESVMLSLFSFALGLLLAWATLPYFNQMLARSLTFPWKAWWLLPIFGAGALIVGFLAGLYPSFYLSSFRPAQVLKGNVSRGSKNAATRSVLVVFQFTVSIVLIAGTFVINRQMNYILTKKTGFDKDQVLLLQGAHTLQEKIIPFKAELLRVPGVKSASISGFLPVANTSRNGSPVWLEGQTKEASSVGCQQWRVDHDYAETLGLKILEGRDFSYTLSSDSQAVVINSTLAKALNLKKAVGARITNGRKTYDVIGVMEDFHFESLRQNIEPLMLMIGRSPQTVSVKVSTADMPHLIKAVSEVWKTFSPNQPVRYTFLDQSYARMYDDVDRVGSIFSSFAVLAIIVACLGLFALSAFMVEQRGKEISIRLVLGASLKNIFSLLTLNFLKLVIISLIIAVPISLYMAREWLKDFAYRTEIGWDIFVFAGIVSLLIAVLTISYQSVRAALMDPVKSLRSE